MQIRPEQWTHHHTHRLFHISLGVVFGFVALTLAVGMFTVWRGATATDIISNRDVTISATVGGVNPGPIEPGSGGGTPPAVPASETPTVTIAAEPRGQVPTRPTQTANGSASAYVFASGNPAFSGQTSINGGMVFVTISGPQTFNSTALADDHGQWFWQAPYLLTNGTYLITVRVYNPSDLSKVGSASTYFVLESSSINPPSNNGNGSGNGGVSLPPPPGQNSGTAGGSNAGQKLFGVFVQVLDTSKEVTAGRKIVAAITLFSNSKDAVNKEQIISYTIADPDGIIIVESNDTVSFSRMSRFLKTIITNQTAKPGKYVLTVNSSFNGVTSTASDTFVLRSFTGVATTQTNATNYVVLWSLLILLLLLFILLVFIAYHQVRLVTYTIRQRMLPR